ncbi:hypothetical protein J2S16_002308 [Cytobacillus kochii]|nr:hypothetical protein [Cytobacillus kochii]
MNYSPRENILSLNDEIVIFCCDRAKIKRELKDE